MSVHQRKRPYYGRGGTHVSFNRSGRYHRGRGHHWVRGNKPSAPEGTHQRTNRWSRQEQEAGSGHYRWERPQGEADRHKEEKEIKSISPTEDALNEGVESKAQDSSEVSDGGELKSSKKFGHGQEQKPLVSMNEHESLQRWGRNKLVSPSHFRSKISSAAIDEIRAESEVSLFGTGKTQTESGISTTAAQHKPLHRRSGVKLESARGTFMDENESQVQREFHRRGRNKLVCAFHVESSTSNRQTDPTTKCPPVNMKKRPWNEMFYGNKKVLAKRVKLQADGEESTESGKLTEFAYKKGKRGRGRNKLIRVQPDVATTPICSWFLRGVDCKDVRCTKRHDVPREAAIPICLFFQRQGQCEKGSECKFRHIKVNPHATICPSFSLLGFCEQEDCQMKHIHATKPKKEEK